jgi:DNA repair protein RadC
LPQLLKHSNEKYSPNQPKITHAVITRKHKGCFLQDGKNKEWRQDMKKKSIYHYSLRRKKVMEFHENERLNMPENVYKFLQAVKLDEEEQEYLIVLILNAKSTIRAYYTVSIGLIDTTQAHAREVFRNAILYGASRIILAHNHPSGSPEPSTEDIKMTSTLAKAGKIIGIDVLDHIIIGNGFFSFCLNGKMEELK